MSLGPSAAAGDAPVADSHSHVVELRIPAERRFHAPGRLVAGGLAARLGLDVDQMDDLRLAVEALVLQTPAAESLVLTMTESDDALEIQIGPFVPNDAGKQELERVLGALVDDFVLHGTEQRTWIVVKVARRPDSRARSARAGR